MEGEHGMIPMGEPDDIESSALPSDATPADATPPTVKARTAVQQEVTRLLDTLAPERAANRAGRKTNEVERSRTSRGCVLQAEVGAVTVSWFPDSAQGAELGELQVVRWSGTVSTPGSSKRTAGAQVVEELVLRPVESGTGAFEWRATDATPYSTEALAAHCEELLRLTGLGSTNGNDVA